MPQPRSDYEQNKRRILDADGNGLTSTTVGADQALDVNVVQTTGGSGGYEVVGLKNVAETTINPATEDTLATIESNQLPDGHNVTVDNAGGAAAVPIQDGGNTITVDGTVAVTNADLSTIAGDTTSIDGKITACNTGAIAGTVTANAGTNLNTSSLALESTLQTMLGNQTDGDHKTKIVGSNSSLFAAVQLAGEWGTPILSGPYGLNVNTLFHFWNPVAGTYDAISGDDNWYAGLMTNEGEFVCATGAIINSAGNRVRIATGTGTAGTSAQRVCLATDVSLPAGTNAIGKLSANSGVDIGDVDVTSVPTAVTTSLGYLDKQWTIASVTATNSGDTQLLAGAGGSLKYRIKKITATNNHTVNITVNFQETGSATAMTGFGSKLIPAYGGEQVWYFEGKGQLQTTANTRIDINLSAAASGGIMCVVEYVTE